MSANVAHLAILHVAVTCALAGLVWVVQLAVYPLFDGVGRDGFPAFHRRYVRGVSFVVAPLMGAEVVTAALLVLQGARGPLLLGSFVLIATIWLVTFLVELPQHRRLAGGFDPEAHRVLVFANWARTLAWTARAVMVGAWLFTLTGA
jgi:hypothetical protein